jgi:DNA-binding NarL/FixJ family response regulator
MRLMCSIHNAEPIRVGVLTEEPIRREGLAGIFEDRPGEGYAPLVPVFGKMEEFLSDATLALLVVDLNSFSGGVAIVETIRRRRPQMRLIVIGPEGNDKLVMDLMLAGVRAYLDMKAGPRIVRRAVEEVASGSIWAPRRLLTKLIDRLVGFSDTSLINGPPHLTGRERQVLERILKAHSNREIAHELGIKENTVQALVCRLLRKTGADNRIDLLMHASSNPSLLHTAGILDRRQRERRQGDRRQGPFRPHDITYK